MEIMKSPRDKFASGSSIMVKTMHSRSNLEMAYRSLHQVYHRSCTRSITLADNIKTSPRKVVFLGYRRYTSPALMRSGNYGLGNQEIKTIQKIKERTLLFVVFPRLSKVTKTIQDYRYFQNFCKGLDSP